MDSAWLGCGRIRVRREGWQLVSSGISWGIAGAGARHKTDLGGIGGTRLCSVLAMHLVPPAIESELVDP